MACCHRRARGQRRLVDTLGCFSTVAAIVSAERHFSPTPAPAFKSLGPPWAPTYSPTYAPTIAPTFAPTFLETPAPTFSETPSPTFVSTPAPTLLETPAPTAAATLADASLNVTLIPVDKKSKKYASYVKAAVKRWKEIISGDLPDLGPVEDVGGTDWFYGLFPGFEYTGPVDDMVVAYQVRDFSAASSAAGENTVAAFGSTIFNRLGDQFTTISGSIVVNDAIFGILSDDDVHAILLHEMGHVFGLGNAWDSAGCTRCTPATTSTSSSVSGSDTASGSPNYNFDGTSCPLGQAAYESLDGAGKHLLVETSGGPGTACGHWDELTYGTELMTGLLNGGGDNPISVFTIGALEDLGYVVDYDAADPYELPDPGRRLIFEENQIDLRNDIDMTRPPIGVASG